MKAKDVLLTGLMLFSLFFGAGNLIFPPYLGMERERPYGLPFVDLL
ncbi:Branched-chain amino acid transport protein [Geobacillus sp. BCO2]|nr:Branched-chain amino acid transport protein [Geobacillus sp. BCO2]